MKSAFLNFLVVQFLFVTTAFADYGVIKIPLKTLTKPASDLRLNGKDLSFSDLSELHSQGFDLSNINPIENKYWQNKKYDAVNTKLHKEMPQIDTSVQFDSILGGNRELGYYTIVIKSKDNQRYLLTLGQQIHASLLKSALLRKLGYYQESPKYYKKIQVDFESKEDKENFINSAFCENGPNELAIDCLSIAPFKSATNNKEYLSQASEKSIYIHGIYLEKMNPEVPSLFDGLTPANENTIPYFSTSRAFRALAVPFVIGDLGESLNRVSTQAVSIKAGWAYINYAFAQYFNDTSHDDFNWMLKRVVGLSDKDWNDIIEASAYPKSLQPLVKSLILLRTKNLSETFLKKTESKLNVDIPSLYYSSDDGYVVKGKVVVENIPGYPQRFSNGDRQSPFESGDFLRYLKVKGISSAVTLAMDKLQEVLKQQFTIPIKEHISGFEVSDKGVKPIGYTIGVQGGNNYSASRVLTTGTFFGSQAPIQLVDNVNISTSIGIMQALSDVGGLNRALGGNVQYSKDFTHVKPLNSIKESSTIPWKDLVVESKLKKIGDVLKTGNINTFLNELRIGEVFIISESIAFGAQAGAQLGLDSLIGFNSGAFSPTVGLTAGGGKVLLRQIQIIKTEEGLQVFVRDQNSKAFSLSLDFNYFINLMKIKAETLKTDLHTDAFILNYDSEFMSKVGTDEGQINIDEDENLKAAYEKSKAFGNKMAAAIRGLIFQSSTDQLYSDFKFQRFSIDHLLKTKMLKTKILWYRSTQLKESHLLTIQKPEIITPEGTQVVNQPIQIITHRQGELKGRDILGFGLEAIDGTTSLFLKGYAPKLSQQTQNSTQMPFGKAYWRIVKTESEVNEAREGALPTMASIQHVWGGWSLKKNKLDQLVASVNESLKGTEYEGQTLIPDENFRTLEKLDFFKVTSNLVLLPGAIEKIKSLVIFPDTQGLQIEKSAFVSRLWRNIFNKKDPARLEDKAIYNNIITMIGNGSYEQGRSLYLAECNKYSDGVYSYNYTWLKGTSYECLEPWLEKVIKISRKFQKNDRIEQNKLLNELIFVLEEKINFSALLKYLGKENYLYFIEISGFRTGDENADQGTYISNIIGEPQRNTMYSNGLIGVISQKSKIVPTEINRTQADFQ